MSANDAIRQSITTWILVLPVSIRPVARHLAQAMVEMLVLVSVEASFTVHRAARLW
jgi:hypothetical protein